jgi:cyclic pyranopterin phosphate synthase
MRMAELAVQFRPMIDGFGSHITYIRLSVTDRCDLRCRYCMDEAMQLPPREDNLRPISLKRSATLVPRSRRLRQFLR